MMSSNVNYVSGNDNELRSGQRRFVSFFFQPASV